MRFTDHLEANVALVQRYFPHYQLKKDGDDIFYEGVQSNAAGTGNFVVRLYVPSSPERVPKAVIWEPRMLPKYDGGTVNDHPLSHRWHTLKNGPGGRVSPCHTDPSRWDASSTHMQALLKVSIWLEAYCSSLETREPVASFLRSS